MAPPKRPDRINETILRELALILRDEIKDPRVTDVLVSRVEVSADLSQAKIYIRNGLGNNDEATKKEMLAGLTAATGKLRRELGRAVTLRQVPNLIFRFDEGLDHALRIEQILDDIKRDGGKS